MLWPLSALWPDAWGPFMRHERWDSALFLHWPLPRAQVQALLPAGLTVDTGELLQEKEAVAWLGLVLLSELGVGPAGCCRSCSPLVDHHGANLRVYVRGPDGPGIYFLSLECSSLLASAGARLMAIPYWPGAMTRTTIEATTEGGRRFQITGRRCSCRCQGRTLRWKRFSSALVSCSWAAAAADSNAALAADHDDSSAEQWASRTRFFLERYRVYTHRGGALYSGSVLHRPWPVGPAELRQLQQSLSGAISGLPSQLGKPAHCCFSEGVGPVDFHMLRPSVDRASS